MGFAFEFPLSNAEENVRLVVYSAAAFLVPFLLEGPQLLVGTIVNAMLVLAAPDFRDSRVLPVIFLPSVAALSRGVVFGPFTPLLAVMMPFIWAGNAALVFGIRRLVLAGINAPSSVAVAACAKSLTLFVPAYVLVSASILPSLFLGAMGIVQLVTAIIGGALALLVWRVQRNAPG